MAASISWSTTPASTNLPLSRPSPKESFHKLFNINVLGLLLTTQAAVKHLGEGSSIINIGSGVSRITPANSSVYTGTKGAVDAITGVLARELGPRKIRVNTINPGMVETEGTVSGGFIGSDFEKELVAQAPLGRTGQGRRYRFHRGLSGFGRLRLADRGTAACHRRHSLRSVSNPSPHSTH